MNLVILSLCNIARRSKWQQRFIDCEPRERLPTRGEKHKMILYVSKCLNNGHKVVVKIGDTSIVSSIIANYTRFTC